MFALERIDSISVRMYFIKSAVYQINVKLIACTISRTLDVKIGALVFVQWNV